MIVDANNDLLEALNSIPASDLDYDDWLKVGMALKSEGYDVDIWDSWSRNDSRYKKNVCTSKWKSFNGAYGSPVTGATIYKLAQTYGWRPSSSGAPKVDGLAESSVLGWDSEIGGAKDWNPGQELITYLETLFEPSDIIGYVTDDVYQQDGRWMPGKGTYRRTAGDIIEGLKKHPDDIGAVIGDCKPECGAWIRFNALDGKGIKNENVTSFKYVLVESDTMPVSEQEAMYRKLQLPIACMVHSGGKSVHAIVKVDATNYDDYRERVEYLYDFLADNGMTVDKQNRNPSRLSRMPGVLRNGKQQKLIATNIGKTSWDEWKTYVQKSEPKEKEKSIDYSAFRFHDAVDVDLDNVPEPEIFVEGLLTDGCYLIDAPSKTGKSRFVLQLLLDVVDGKSFLNHYKTKHCEAIYLALEDEAKDFEKRYRDFLSMSNRRKPTGLHYLLKTDFPYVEGDGYQVPTLDDDNLCKLVKSALKQYPDARLVVVDVLNTIRAKKKKRGDDTFDMEKRDIQRLVDLATQLDICLLIAHHVGEGKKRDFIVGAENSTGAGAGSYLTSGTVIGELCLQPVKGDGNRVILRGRGRRTPDTAVMLRSNYPAWEYEQTVKEFEERATNKKAAEESNAIVMTAQYLLDQNEGKPWQGTLAKFREANEGAELLPALPARLNKNVFTESVVNQLKVAGIAYKQNKNGGANVIHRFERIDKKDWTAEAAGAEPMSIEEFQSMSDLILDYDS